MTHKGKNIVVVMDPELEELIPNYLENRHRDVQSIVDARVQGDFEAIRLLAHSMKGSGGGYGFDAIHQHRVARPPGPGIKEKRLRLEILTLGTDMATVNLEFKVRGQDLIGRQSQTWVCFPDQGWKVISAHVSTTDGKSLW